MVLVDLSKRDLENILESIDQGNWLDYDDDGELHRLRSKIWDWLKQKNFVYFQGEMLSEEDGENFIVEFERPATKEELEYAKEADEFFRKTPLIKISYCYSCKKEERDWHREVCTDCFKKI